MNVHPIVIIGIAAGTRWKDIPADWSCPECGVAKADFEMVLLAA